MKISFKIKDFPSNIEVFYCQGKRGYAVDRWCGLPVRCCAGEDLEKTGGARLEKKRLVKWWNLCEIYRQERQVVVYRCQSLVGPL
jgi:hypothetical protein